MGYGVFDCNIAETIPASWIQFAPGPRVPLTARLARLLLEGDRARAALQPAAQ